MMKFCPECGYKLEANVKFCPECGYRLSDLQKQDNSSLKKEIKFESSEDLIKHFLKNAHENADISIAPEITEKKLVSAAETIGNGADTMKVTGLIDTTVFHSGKEGILFLGDKVYLRPAFGNSVCIEYD